MTTEAPDHAQVRVIAPLAFALAFCVGASLKLVIPLPALSGAARWGVGFALLAPALLIGASALFAMRRAGTSPNPHAASTALVEAGPFGFTRNPMYVSMVLASAAFAVLLRVTGALLALPLAVIAVEAWVIRPEERYLAQRFGESYAGYMRRVRRWI